jgi:hypothetical protein
MSGWDFSSPAACHYPLCSSLFASCFLEDTLRFYTPMAPKIYRSPFPDVPVYDRSIFTHLFPPNTQPGYVGEYPGDSPAYIDAPTGTTLTRGQTRHLALSLAYGLRHHPTTQATRGETILIYSQNMLAWPIALFGSGKCFTSLFRSASASG